MTDQEYNNTIEKAADICETYRRAKFGNARHVLSQDLDEVAKKIKALKVKEKANADGRR